MFFLSFMHMAHDILSAKCNITHLSDDLLAEIFSRLTFRSTVGCKCVSKRWLDLISSPYFKTQLISNQHTFLRALLIFLTPHQLMLSFLPPCSSDLPPRFINNNPLPEKFNFSIDMLLKGNVCGSSNGLFLCCSNRYTTGNDFFVCEPLTKECIQIPPSPARPNGNVYAVGFVCEPHYYDQEEEDEDGPDEEEAPAAPVIPPPLGDRSFRVVIIRSFIKRLFQFELDVFSSETGLWKQQIMICQEGFAFAPHWLLSYAYDGSLYFMGRTGIFVFDPYTHHSFTLDYPEGADSGKIMSFGFLGSSCGCLRIADIGDNDLRVWELIDDENWYLLHMTNLTTKFSKSFCDNYHKRVAGFHPYDGDIVYLHSYADGVFLGNLKTETFEAIPGYDKSDISPFQLELPDLLPPSKSPSSLSSAE